MYKIAPVNTHALIVTTPEGHRLELGRLGSLERAAALGRRLQDELGDEFTRFEYLELDALESDELHVIPMRRVSSLAR